MSGGGFSSLALTLCLILLCVSTTCTAKTSQFCKPSSCGKIQNVSFPFRLKTDPHNCDNPGPEPEYELVCDNNQSTIIYLESTQYHVQSISYENQTIRVVDPALRDNLCPAAFPVHSYSSMDDYGYPSTLSCDYSAFFLCFRLPLIENTPVLFVNCSKRVDSPLYVITPAICNHTKTSSSSSSNTSAAINSSHSYVILGKEVMFSDLHDSCKIVNVGFVSNEFPIADKTSFSSILDAMSNGFSFEWHSIYNYDYPYVQATPTGFRRFLDGLRTYWEEHSATLFDLIKKSLFYRFFVGLPCLLILLVYKYRRHHLSVYENIEDFLQGQNNLVPIRYSYWEIRRMTSNFKEKLGEGGYGSVYKGKLRSGIFVAVKMMRSKSKANGQDFINEVATIGRIHHVNVVQLVGFCVDGSKRALVYEFMPNGSLDKYVFPKEEEMSDISLSYEKMFEISVGVARGIDYLHRGCEMQILHFDIKPHNILLDENFTPKISDFGLAKLYSTDDSIASLTAARGTMGYMAPELFYKNIGRVSYKADVYSYGMLLMEMAGKRKNLNPFAENLSQIYFPSWVYDQMNEGKEIAMGDASGELEKKMVKRMILVGLWCIQMKPVDRPSMNKIVEMLEAAAGDDDEHYSQMPPKPFLYPEEFPTDEDHEILENDNEFPLFSGDFTDSAGINLAESQD